jgi:transcriptional regulator with XRE-family HTH domain
MDQVDLCLVHAMAARGLQVSDMAVKLGVSEPTVLGVLYGRIDPIPELKEAMARALSVSRTLLFPGEWQMGALDE